MKIGGWFRFDLHNDGWDPYRCANCPNDERGWYIDEDITDEELGLTLDVVGCIILVLTIIVTIE